MKIDFSNPPQSVRNAAISPVRSALESIRLANEANTVTKSKVSKALAGVEFRLSEKTIELYAPAPKRRAPAAAAASTAPVNTVSIADNSKSTSNMLAAFWGQFNKKA
jgi:hypothetical protein